MAGVNDRKRRITLHLYDTDLIVFVAPAEEADYREGEKLITGVIDSYMSRFTGTKTEREIMYMALIDLAVRYVREQQRKDLTPYNDILSQLTAEIEQTLKE